MKNSTEINPVGSPSRMNYAVMKGGVPDGSTILMNPEIARKLMDPSMDPAALKLAQDRITAARGNWETVKQFGETAGEFVLNLIPGKSWFDLPDDVRLIQKAPGDWRPWVLAGVDAGVPAAEFGAILLSGGAAAAADAPAHVALMATRTAVREEVEGTIARGMRGVGKDIAGEAMETNAATPGTSVARNTKTTDVARPDEPPPNKLETPQQRVEWGIRRQNPSWNLSSENPLVDTWPAESPFGGAARFENSGHSAKGLTPRPKPARSSPPGGGGTGGPTPPSPAGGGGPRRKIPEISYPAAGGNWFHHALAALSDAWDTHPKLTIAAGAIVGTIGLIYGYNDIYVPLASNTNLGLPLPQNTVAIGKRDQAVGEGKAAGQKADANATCVISNTDMTAIANALRENRPLPPKLQFPCP